MSQADFLALARLLVHVNNEKMKEEREISRKDQDYIKLDLSILNCLRKTKGE